MTQKTYERTKDAVLHALKSMSASDIARLCDVDPGKVSRWKSGDLNAKYNRIKPLLEKIGPLPTEGNRRLFRVVPDPLTISPDLLDSIQPESFSSKDWLLNALARELEDIRGVGEGEYWKFEHELYRYIPEEPKQDSMDKKEEKAKLIQEMLRQKATRLEEVFLKVQQAESDEDIEIDFGVFSEWVVEKFYGQAAGFAHARQTAWEFLSQFSGQEISLPKLLTQHSVALAKKAKVREYQWAEELRENLATEGCMLEMIDQIAQYNAMVYELFKQARQEVQVTGDVVFQKRWDEKKGQFSLDRPFYDRINFKCGYEFLKPTIADYFK